MPLASRCSHAFDSEIRNRGQLYYRQDRVSLLARGSNHVRAVVRGENEYQVVLDWGFSREQLAAGCTCPYFEDHDDCKHIWAAILAADAAKIGPRGTRQLGILALDPEDLGDDDEELWLADDNGEDDGDLPHGPGRGSGAKKSRGKSPPKPSWRQQLAWSGADEHGAVVPVVGPRPPKIREIWYVLAEGSGEDSGRPLVLLRQREMKANGQFGKLKLLNLGPHEVSQMAEPQDAEILALLLGYHDAESRHLYYGYSPRIAEVLLPKGVQQFLLQKMAATGRLALAVTGPHHLPEMMDLQPLSWDDGPPWRFRLNIDANDAEQRWTLSGQLYREGESRLVQQPRAIFKQGVAILENRVAMLEAGGSWWMIEALRKTPRVEVPYQDRWELLRRLWQLPAAPEMSSPENLRVEEVSLPPLGRLRIDKPDRYDPYRLPGHVDFLYDDKVVAAQETARGIVDEEKGRVIVRDRLRERDLAAGLAARGVRPMEGWQADKFNVWVPSQKLPEAAEALVRDGWIVEAQGYFVRRAGTWRMNVTSGVDWFDLSGTLNFDGMEVHLPEILEALRQGQHYVKLKDGSRGILPQDWVDRFASMAELGKAEGEAIRFRSSQALLLDALLAAQDQVTIDAPFSRLRENLRSFNGVGPAAEPAGFSGELRQYQKVGLGWLHFLEEFRLGGCLADDMGLGKTVQVLAMLQERRQRPAKQGQQRPPSLAVVPRSLVFNWIEEARRFTPKLRVLDYTGLQRGSLLSDFDDYDLVVTTYGTMQRDIVKLKDRRFDYAILDESQAIKKLPLAASEGQPATEGRSSPGDDRNAGGEPLGRALVAAGVPQSGHARLGVGFPGSLQKGLGRRRGVGASPPCAGAFHSPPHETAGLDRAAAKDRADAALRPGGQPAETV